MNTDTLFLIRDLIAAVVNLASQPAPVVLVPQAPVAPAAITVADFIAPPDPSESATPIDTTQEATAIEHA